MHGKAAVVLLILLVACGQESPSADPAVSPSVPSQLEVICHLDGSTELVTTEVAASPDGVHIRVDNRAGEGASLNGTGLDFNKGVTTQSALVPPGELKIACWPGSMHGGPEPKRQAVTVHDPHGYFSQADAELECPRDELQMGSTLDYGGYETGEHGDPEDIVRRSLEGLEPDDRLFTAGYPEAEFRTIGVERADETIALVRLTPTEDGGWVVGGFEACDSARISV